jgi:heat shock protein HtpX
MISALRKISGHSKLEHAPDEVREMFIDNGVTASFAGLFATHPPIEKRIKALVDFAGGRDLPPPPSAPEIVDETTPSGPWTAPAPKPAGPWS